MSASDFLKMIEDGNGYVMGRGKLFFTPFSDPDAQTIAKGVPREFLGNVPNLGLTINSTNYDHYDSTGGTREKDASVPLQTDRSATFTVEKVSTTNMARFMMGTPSTLTQAAATGYTETVDVAYLNRTYQVGVTLASPMGASLLSNFQLFKGTDATGTALVEGSDYVVDATNGMYKLLPTSPNLKGDGTESLFVKTDIGAASRLLAVSGNKAAQGRVDFVADAAFGRNWNIMIPCATLRPNGELAMIGDAFMAVPFTMDIGKTADYAAVYAIRSPDALG